MKDRYKSTTKSGGPLGAKKVTRITDRKTGRWVEGGGKNAAESRKNADKRRKSKGW